MIVFVSAAHARDLSSVEKTALSDTVNRFSDAIRSSDFDATIRISLPPRILDHVAKSNGTTGEDVARGASEVLRKALTQVKIEDFAIDLASADFRELSDGTPYVFIPTKTVLSVEGQGKFVVGAHCLAMLDGDQWYLLRTSDLQQKMLLTAVYPAFFGIEFPSESIQSLKE